MPRKPAARPRPLHLESLEDRAVPAGGTLYGVTFDGELFTVDTATGAASPAAVLEFDSTGIEYNPLTGRGVNLILDFSGNLLLGVQEFDIDTGASLGPAFNNGMDFTGAEFIGPTLYVTFVDEPAIGISALATYDLSTGVVAPVGLTGVFGIGGIAYDAGTGTLYAIASEFSGSFQETRLYTLDPGTGAATLIGPVSGFDPFSFPSSLEFGPDGRLYATASIDGPGQFYTIDPATAVATRIATTQLLGLALRADLTQTVVSSSLNPAAPGDTVTFTATVSPVLSGPGVPTGTVTFFDGTAILGTVPLVNGAASFQTSSLGVGTHPITAVYSGGPNFADSASAPLSQEVLVPPPPPPPPTLPGIRVIGADAGGEPRVQVFDSTGALRLNFLAYDASFRGGVRVASGDVNSDGVDDIIAAPGPGGAPHVRVFDGRDGSPLFSIFAFDPGWMGGLFVTTGDVCGDAAPDVIVGADAGGAPHVKAFDAATMAQFASFFAFSPSFSGGVRVAAGDVNGDGADDIITAAGPGSGPHVRIIDVTTGFEIASFYAFAPTLGDGVYVAVGDVDGDGRDDVVAGAGSFPHVAVFSGGLVSAGSFFAAPDAIPSGARVAAGDVTGDGRAEIVVGLGPGNPPIIQTFDAIGTQTGTFSVLNPDFLGGIYVA